MIEFHEGCFSIIMNKDIVQLNKVMFYFNLPISWLHGCSQGTLKKTFHKLSFVIFKQSYSFFKTDME